MGEPGPKRERPIFDRALVAKQLASAETPHAIWSVPFASDVTLRYAKEEIEGQDVEFYWLSSFEAAPEGSMQARTYTFEADGKLYGVTSSECQLDDEGQIVNLQQVMQNVYFQLANGLIAPTPGDEVMLDRLLEAGLDNPTYTAGDIPQDEV